MYNRLCKLLGVTTVWTGVIGGIHASAISDHCAAALCIACMANEHVHARAHIAHGLRNAVVSLWERAWNCFGHPATESVPEGQHNGVRRFESKQFERMVYMIGWHG